MTCDGPALGDLRCQCGATAILAIKPGAEPIRSVSGRIFLTMGEPISAWCSGCWPWSRQGELFSYRNP